MSTIPTAKAEITGHPPAVEQTANPVPNVPLRPVRLADTVLYLPRPGEPGAPGIPQAAIVTHAWGETAVNVAIWDANGAQYSRTSIRFYPNGLESIPEDVLAHGGVATFGPVN